MFKLLKSSKLIISYIFITATSSLGVCFASLPLGFYDNGKIGYEFTNFYPSEISEQISSSQVIKYKFSEAYFQAKKFNVKGSQHVIVDILKANTPKEVFTIAQKNVNLTRPGWHGTNGQNVIKDSVMKDALRLKFTQNPYLGCLLMATDGIELREDSPTDLYWGTGGAGSKAGANFLGRFLVYLRTDLLNGTHKLDWSNKNCVPLQVTLDYLKQNNRLAYYHYLTAGNVPISYKKFLKKMLRNAPQPAPQNANNNNAKVYLNKNYAVVKAGNGFGTDISNSINNLFNGLAKTPSIEITKNKNMLIVTASAQEAAEMLVILKGMGQAGINIDNKNKTKIFVHNVEISAFLEKVLKFDKGFISSFFKKKM